MEDFQWKDLMDNDIICFGPSTMELGWEITRWSSFIRWFKKRYSHKKIYVATREDRIDLYYGAVDDVFTFKIKGDYEKYRPNMYHLDFFPKTEYENLVVDVQKVFPKAFIFRPPITNNRNFFPKENVDFKYTPREENKMIINLMRNRFRYK